MPSPLQWLRGSHISTLEHDLGLALLRCAGGLMLAFHHGWHKLSDGLQWASGSLAQWHFLDEVVAVGFPAPIASAWAATAAQLLGGVLLALGWWTRPAALVIVGALAGATYTNLVLAKDGQLAHLYLLVAGVVLITGPGRFALDARRASPTTTANPAKS